MTTPDTPGAQPITVLRTLGPLLAKRWQADGSITSYDDAKHYHVALLHASNLHELAILLAELRREPTRCIIRGQPRVQGPILAPVRRVLQVFEDAPSHLFMLDSDKYECVIHDPRTDPAAAIREFIDELPEPFRRASYVWQLSGSAGHPSAPTRLRAHLWFWLAEPTTCAQAEAWTKHYLPGLADSTVHRTVQVNYTADPLLPRGTDDPCVQRFGYHPGSTDTLDLTALALPALALWRATTSDTRRHVDPRAKAGVVGAVCRAWAPEQIVELWPDLFEAGSTPSRITWRVGGGTPEGIGVTSDGHGLFNVHDTSPIGARSANLFDFLRVHAFGHLDAGLDADALDLDVTATPSYQAMDAWAREQADVMQQLDAAQPAVAEAIVAARDANAQQQLDSAEDREQRLQGALTSIAGAADLNALEHAVVRQGLSRMWAGFNDADRDRLLAALKAKARKLAGGAAISIRTIRKWLAHVEIDTGAAFAHRDDSGNPLDTIENFKIVLDRAGIECRYNVITKAQEVIVPKDDASTDNYQRTVTSSIYSLCRAQGMSIGHATVRGYLARLCDINSYNPVEDWIETRAWDGERDYIKELAATITCPDYFPVAAKELYLRKWLIQAVAVACSKRPVQARGVLVLQGEQYIGKTRWLQRLLPDPVSHLVRAGHHLDPHNKDSVKIALSHWIVELGEIGGTMRRSDQDGLKAIISQTVDNIRLPYADAESIFQRRTAFVGSVNEGVFLTDPTGTSRWWTMPVKALNHEHHVDMQQVFAQAMAAWKAGETHFMSTDEMVNVQQNNKQFEVANPVREALEDRFAFKVAQSHPHEVEWMERTASDLCKLANLDPLRYAAVAGRELHRIAGAQMAARSMTARKWRVPVMRNDTALLDNPPQ